MLIDVVIRFEYIFIKRVYFNVDVDIGRVGLFEVVVAAKQEWHN